MMRNALFLSVLIASPLYAPTWVIYEDATNRVKIYETSSPHDPVYPNTPGGHTALMSPFMVVSSTVPFMYWKNSGGNIVEMTTQEKVDLDAEIAALTAAVVAASSTTLSGGRLVRNIAPSDGQALKWSASNSRWEPMADSTGGSSEIVVKTSSTFVRTGNTLASIPNLNTTLSANTTYHFNYYVLFQTTSTTTGARFAVSFSTAPLIMAYTVRIPIAADGTGGELQGWGTTSGDAVIGTAVQAANTSYIAMIYGMAVTNSLGSTINPQIACELSGVPTASAMVNSYGFVRTVP